MGVSPESLVLRADAGIRIGTGHMMRCLALAQAWQDSGGTAAFATAGPEFPLIDRLKAEGCLVERIPAESGSIDDARATAAFASRVGARWIVVDGYHLGDEFESVLKNSGFRILAIDDYGHAEHIAADAILNQNLHASERLYAKRAKNAKLLLGTQFVLLRREFLRHDIETRAIPIVARRALVSLGGSDPDNVTHSVIAAIRMAAIADFEAVVVVGSANPYFETLAKEASDGVGIKILRNAEDMPGLMRWADIGIGAGGTTAWERMFMRLPSIVIALADNQLEIARSLGIAGAAVYHEHGRLGLESKESFAALVLRLAHDIDLRRRVVAAAAGMVDGLGTKRTIELLRS